MIKYSETKIGAKLRIVGMGAPGFAKLGEIVEVTSVGSNRVNVKRSDGKEAFFALTCGAQRLEPVREGGKDGVE